MPTSLLLDRIRGEFREMPGLRVTLPQAQRLWQLEAADCEAALHALVHEGFLGVTVDDTYIALPITARVRLKTLKADFEPTRVRRRA
jgi:hypothetical protein